MARLRYVRRRPNRSITAAARPRPLTAAAQPVTDPAKVKMSTGRDGDWKDAAWDMLDRVGELRFYVSWRAASASRVRLVASEVDEDTGIPSGRCEDTRVTKIVRDIAGGITGQAQLLRRAAAHLTVPGETYLAVITRQNDTDDDEDVDAISPFLTGPEEDREEWHALTRDEIHKRGQGLTFTLDDGSKHEFDPDTDHLFRVWNPHPRKAVDADSPVRAALESLNEIVRATAQIDNASKSRLVGNGVLFVPEEMSLPAAGGPGLDITAGHAGADAATIPGYAQASAQDLTDLLYETATTAYGDQDSLAAFLPVIAQVSGEWTDKIKHVTFDSAVSETAIATRDSAIRRLAMSLDVAPERLLGLGSNSNHWSAWAINEEDVRVHVAPVIETLCDALTRFVLRAKLREIGVDPDRYAVWYDATPLTQDPDKKDEAKDAYDRGALTADGLRRHLGFDAADGYLDDHDDPNSLEAWRRYAVDQARKNPYLLPMLAPLIGGDIAAIDFPAPAGRPGSGPAAAPDTGDTESLPDTEPVDTEPDSYALAYAYALRAVEMGNKRRRTRADHGRFAGAALHEVQTRLDPMTPEAARAAIRGWDTSLDDRVLAAAGMDRAAFVARVETAALTALTRAAPIEVS